MSNEVITLATFGIPVLSVLTLLQIFIIKYLFRLEDRVMALTKVNSDIFVKIEKLQRLENLFIKYEDSVRLSAEAAQKLSEQQEKLEGV